MRDVASSKPSSVKLTNFHIIISSLAAIAGVGLAAYQTFLTHPAAQAPVNVVVSVDPQKADSVVSNETVAKTDVPALATNTVNLADGASFTAALKDGSETLPFAGPGSAAAAQAAAQAASAVSAGTADVTVKPAPPSVADGLKAQLKARTG